MRDGRACAAGVEQENHDQDTGAVFSGRAVDEAGGWGWGGEVLEQGEEGMAVLGGFDAFGHEALLGVEGVIRCHDTMRDESWGNGKRQRYLWVIGKSDSGTNLDGESRELFVVFLVVDGLFDGFDICNFLRQCRIQVYTLDALNFFYGHVE